MYSRHFLLKLFSSLSLATALSLGAAETSLDHDDSAVKRNEAMQAVFNEVDKPDMLLSRLSFYLGLLYNRNDKQGKLIAEHADKRAIALSPDGKYCAFVSDGYLNDFEIKIYDTGTGALVKSFGYKYKVECLAFSSDGRFLFSETTGPFCFVRILDLASGREICQRYVPVPCVESRRFNADCSSVLVMRSSGTQFCWFLKCFPIEARHCDCQASEAGSVMDFGEPGQFVVTNNSNTYLWDLDHKRKIISFPHLSLSNVYDLKYSNNMIAVCYKDPNLKHIDIWDTTTGQLLRKLQLGILSTPAHCFFIADVFLAVGDHSRLNIFDVKTGRLVQELPCEPLYNIHRPPVAADKYGQIAIVDFHNKVRIFNSLPDNIRQKLHSLSFDQLVILTEIVAPLAQGRVIRLTPNSSAWNLVNQMPPEIRALVEPCLH